MISSDWGRQRFEKRFDGANFGPMGLNQAQNEFFCHFLKFRSCIFLKIEYDNSLRQFLTSSRDKIYEKIWWGEAILNSIEWWTIEWRLEQCLTPIFIKSFGGPNLGPTSLSQPQNKAFHHFLGFGSQVFLEIEYDDSLRKCLIFSKGKPHEKKFSYPNL